MNHFRGVLLLVAGCLAFYEGWRIHNGTRALPAYGLGVMAITLAVWRLTRKPDPPRV